MIIPKNYWPMWANYLSIDNSGRVMFWCDKPKYDNGRYKVTSGKRSEWGYVEPQAPELHRK